MKGSMKTSLLIATAVSTALGAAAVLAHHSIAVFDQDKEVTITGTVKKFSYTNPHGWIDLEVPNDKGGVDEWSIEMASQAQLRGRGWTPTTLKAGDKITAVLHPRRDGTKAGNAAVPLTFADGTPVVASDQGMGMGAGMGAGGMDAGGMAADGMGAEGMGGEGMGGGMGGGGGLRQAELTEEPHPLLKDLVPKMQFGWYQQGSRPEGEMTPPTTDPRDFSGRYHPKEATLLMPGGNTTMLAYNDVSAKLFRPRVEDFFAGKLRADVLSLCKPAGVARGMSQGFPMQVQQNASQINLIYLEDHLVQRIYLDQEHPKDLKPSFMGHSVGKWDGNTLVVDIKGFRDGGWMDEYGSPSSEQLHIVERITKQADGLLSFEITLEDPKYYSKPVTYSRTWQWQPNISWDEVICEENNRDAPKT
ncbi:MAG: DUF6152 family protein [Steroidobacteraceae bacterium]